MQVLTGLSLVPGTTANRGDTKTNLPMTHSQIYMNKYFQKFWKQNKMETQDKTSI